MKPISRVEAAWAAFESSIKLDNLDELRKEGWRTVADLVESTGQTDSAVRHLLGRRNEFDRRKIRVPLDGVARTMNVYRPIVSG